MAKVLTIGVPAESIKGEQRVALTPSDVHMLAANEGLHILLEKGAGVAAGFADSEYLQHNNVTKATALQAWGANLVLHVQPPSIREVKRMAKGSLLISHIFPALHASCVTALAKAGVDCVAMELVPRITRAQAVDSLSSQATVSGYWSVLHAAASAPFFFPMITYAAGTVRPAKLLVIGAGVAGLQAIATARRLGAIVEAYDVRPETREQIASLGAKAIDLGFDASGEGGYARELTTEEKKLVAEVLAKHVSKSDIIICTAGLPGKVAPKILTKAHVESMKAGSLIVDMVAESGGNCELTKVGENRNYKGIHILGPTHIPSKLPLHASQMYSRNLMGMVALVVQNKQLMLDDKDAIIQESLLVRNGEVVHSQWSDQFSAKPKLAAKKTGAANRKVAATKRVTSASKTKKPTEKKDAAAKMQPKLSGRLQVAANKNDATSADQVSSAKKPSRSISAPKKLQKGKQKEFTDAENTKASKAKVDTMPTSAKNKALKVRDVAAKTSRKTTKASTTKSKNIANSRVDVAETSPKSKHTTADNQKRIVKESSSAPVEKTTKKNVRRGTKKRPSMKPIVTNSEDGETAQQ